MPSRTRRRLLVLLAGLSLAATAVAAAPQVQPEAGWRTARLVGADVRSLAAAPDDPDVVLAGTSAGHVYRSADGGATWEEAAPSLPLRGWVIGGLVFDPNIPGRVWAALWGIWGGGGVVFSDDLGRTWTDRSAGLPGTQVYTITLAPGRPGRLYAGTREGVWGTADEGGSWRHLSGGEPELVNVSSLLVPRENPDAVIAGTWRRAYRSDDGGGTWRGIFEGMVLDSEVFSLHEDPRRPGSVWASTCGWVYHTADLGSRWQRHQEGLAERRTPSFQILPGGGLLAGTVSGAYRSDDEGRTWARVTQGKLPVLSIATHPRRPERVWIGTEGAAVWRSVDGGRTFVPSGEGMTNTRVSALLASGGEVLAAVPHAGPGSGIYRSRDGGLRFEPTPDEMPTVLDLARHQGRPYAATEQGLFVRQEGRWQRIAELGETRIDQLATGDGRLVARAGARLWELRLVTERLKLKTSFVDVNRERFVEVPYRHGPPRSIAVGRDGLWVSDATALYHLADGSNHTLEPPFAGGRVAALGGGQLLAGSAGAWRRDPAGGAWTALRKGPTRVLPTGDATWPALLLGESDGALVGADGRLMAVALPVAARDVLAAGIVDGRLLLGTSGYGLVLRELWD